jgi:hypothetical protein
MRGILGRQQKKFGKLSALAMNVGSVALAIEALEALLVKKGVLKDSELMEKIQEIVKTKQEGVLHGNHGVIAEANHGHSAESLEGSSS